MVNHFDWWSFFKIKKQLILYLNKGFTNYLFTFFFFGFDKLSLKLKILIINSFFLHQSNRHYRFRQHYNGLTSLGLITKKKIEETDYQSMKRSRSNTKNPKTKFINWNWQLLITSRMYLYRIRIYIFSYKKQIYKTRRTIL